MSKLTITEPDVLTGHIDVICFTSIESIVTDRNAALVRTEALIRLLNYRAGSSTGVGSVQSVVLRLRLRKIGKTA